MRLFGDQTNFASGALLALSLMSAVAITFIAPVAIAQEKPEAPPAIKVTAEKALVQPVAKTMWVSGTVVSQQDAQVAAQISGQLLMVANVGQSFKKGEVIARLDSANLAFDLEEQKATIQQLTARLTLLEKQVKRLTQVAKSQSASKDELDEKQAEQDIASHALIQAKAVKRRIENNIDKSYVKAPFDGIIVERMLQQGEYGQVGQTIIRMVNMNNKEAIVKAPLEAAHYIASNSMLKVKQGKHTQDYKVTTLVPMGNSLSRMMELRIDLTNSALAVGSAVRAELPMSESEDLLTVHRDAIVLRKQGSFVFMIDDESIARKIPVEIGAGQGDFIAITGDIEEGEQVIVRGAERVKEGQAVKLNKANAEVAKL